MTTSCITVMPRTPLGVLRDGKSRAGMIVTPTKELNISEIENVDNNNSSTKIMFQKPLTTRNQHKERQPQQELQKASIPQVRRYKREELMSFKDQNHQWPRSLNEDKLRFLMLPPDELEDHRESQRSKQIIFGQNTEGWRRFDKFVPVAERLPSDPNPPSVSQRCSKRSWDGQIRKWRRTLHLFDLIESREQCDQIRSSLASGSIIFTTANDDTVDE